MKMDEKTQIELEAAAFRHLVGFLQEKTDVQNIDLMNLAGFCRNCLSKWYLAAAEERGVEIDYEKIHCFNDISGFTLPCRKGV